MTVKLPNALNIYFEAANAGDPKTGSECFANHGTVVDEGETLSGRDAIYAWLKSTKAKYNHQTTPLKSSESQSGIVVSAEIRGTFPGSPALLEFNFELEGDLISKLRILLP